MFRFDTVLKASLLAFIASACGGSTTASLLSISVTNKAFIIPAGTMYDRCYAGTTSDPAAIAAPYFSLAKIATTWKGSGSLLPVILKISINSSSNIGTLNCVQSTSSGNISSQLGFTTVEINKGSAEYIAASSNNCPIICGGVSVANPTVAFSVTGTVKIYGIQTVVEGGQEVQRPVTAIDTFTLENIP